MAALSGTTAGLDADSAYGSLHSSQVDGGQNYAALQDRLIDQWLDEARRSLDPATRRAAYRRIGRRLQDLQPYTYLFFPLMRAAVRRGFENVEPSPFGVLDPYPGPARFQSSETSRR